MHQSGEIIAGKYRILNILGQGGMGITYEAEDIQNSQRIALKVLSLRQTDDLKVLELFEREAQILAQLNHTSIPRYLDYFYVEKRRHRFFYIAQQLAQGQSLAELIEQGWQPNIDEVKSIAIALLKILVYLQKFTPPIIHRDIKPQNIIRSDDGQIFLVDFGAVRDTYHHTLTGGSTVIGTYGYMAPEQFRGQAVLATDLYGLGNTILFLLTQKSPADLPQHKFKIDVHSLSLIQGDTNFLDWIEKMIEPIAKDRFHSAKEALAVLQGKQVFRVNSTSGHQQRSQIALLKTKRSLIAEIKPIWLSNKKNLLFGLLTLICKLVLLVSLFALPVLTTLNVIAGGPIYLFGYYLPNWLLIFLKLLIEFGMIFIALYVLIGSTTILYWLLKYSLHTTSRTWLKIDQNNFCLQKWFLGICYQKVQGKTKDINQFKLSNRNLLMLRSKLRKYYFGLFMTKAEKEWLIKEVQGFLAQPEN